MQVHSQLTLVCRAGQSQLILVENGADCRSERFRLQVVTDKESVIVTSKRGPQVVNRNYGVFGLDLLPKKIEQATAKFRSWSDDQIKQYRMSHGHCVATAY